MANNNYQNNYPGLQALASNAPDSPAGAVVAGTPLSNLDVAAARRQTKRRRMLAERGAATQDEVIEAKKREFGILAENAGAAAIPAWAMGIQNQLNNMQNQLYNMEDRQLNLSASLPDSPIRFLRNNAGNLPAMANLPTTRAGITNLTNAQLNQLAQFYGILNAPVATKLYRLLHFLGIDPRVG